MNLWHSLRSPCNLPLHFAPRWAPSLAAFDVGFKVCFSEEKQTVTRNAHFQIGARFPNITMNRSVVVFLAASGLLAVLFFYVPQIDLWMAGLFGDSRLSVKIDLW